MIKKVICLILAVTLIFSFVVIGFAKDDITGHWCEKEIRILINNGVITGYSDNSIKPYNNITRAEYAKIINKLFGYTEPALEGFNDLSSESWYYNDLLIAKKAGYMVGDENGNANPESNITRAETAVITGRVMGLAPVDGKTSFIDDNLIPGWAKGYIAALSNKKLLTGYSDGSFKAGNYIIRGEAFYLLYNASESTVSENVVEDTVENEFNPINITTPSAGGSGGGGGGGAGGGITTPNALAIPTVTKFDEASSTVYFSSVAGADSYKLLIKSPYSSQEYQITSLTAISGGVKADITGYINSFCSSASQPELDIELSIKATATGKTDSAYEKFGNITKIFNAVPTPVVTTVTENDEFTVTWNEVSEASGYDVKIYIDGVLNNSAADIIDVSSRTVKVKTSVTEGKEVELILTALSGDVSVLKNSKEVKTLLSLDKFSGAGTDNDPYIITTERQYKNITDMSAVYVITANLDLSDCAPLGDFASPFKGKIIGKLNNLPGENPTITLNISETADNQGFIGVLDGNGLIKDITVKGIVSGGNYVGGIVGALNKGTISSCINKATVTGISYVGGIAGINAAGTVVELCANLGSVLSTDQYAGGIIGYHAGAIRKSYNTANISSSKNAGGICGYATGAILEVSDCYNTGAISGGAIPTGGICYTFRATEKIILKNNYNTGSISVPGGSTWNSYIALDLIMGSTSLPEPNTNANADLTGNYYLNTLTGGRSKEDFTALTSVQMESIVSFPEFDSSVWFIDPTAAYKYPQLISNQHLAVTKLSTPSQLEVSKIGSELIITFDTENGLIYKVEIFKDGEELNSFENTTGSISYPIDSSLEATYTVKVKTLGDGDMILDSDIAEDSYTHTTIGTDENPYVISTQSQFDAITDFTKVYKITTDLTVTSPINAFSGKFIGDKGNGAKPVITLNISKASAYTGFISQMSDSSSLIDNFIFEGTVSGTTDVGAIVGKATGGTIRNCVNKADISASDTRAGGIIGWADNTKIENCANTASVTTANSNAGGISGYASGVININKCYNSGNITTITKSGGISGVVSGTSVEITNCYNSGNLIINDANAGGITYRIDFTDTVKLKNCYNIGSFIRGTSSTGNAYIVNDIVTGGVGIDGSNHEKADMSGNYYLSSLTGGRAPSHGIMAISDFSNLVNLGYDDSVWEIRSDNNYSYPQLIDNSHMIQPVKLSKPQNVTISKSEGRVLVSCDLVVDASGYNVEVIKGIASLGNYDVVTLPADITSYITESGSYTIKIKAKGNGTTTKDSDATSVNYNHIPGGTDENPYIISSQADFDAITDLTGVYKITTDITVTQPISSFSGKFIGDKGNGEKPVITLDITSTDSSIGFVSVLNGESALIDNFVFEGNISGVNDVGAAVGIIRNGTVKNCINKASVSGTTRIGGISGYLDADGKIELCGNAGNVLATSSNAAGISGYMESVIDKCFNSGEITAPKYAGGITGQANGADIVITNCYNSGTLKAGSSANAGGLTYRIDFSNSVTVKNNYNVGPFVRETSSTWNAYIVNDVVIGLNQAIDGSTHEKADMSENYYLSSLTGGRTPSHGIISTNDFTSLIALGFDSSVWEIRSDNGYNYPQLIENPHIVIYND